MAQYRHDGEEKEFLNQSDAPGLLGETPPSLSCTKTFLILSSS